jgi:hypothetical protein
MSTQNSPDKMPKAQRYESVVIDNDHKFEFVGKNRQGQTTVLGRTGASWAKISLFYFIYYSLLAALIYFSVTLRADYLATHPGDRKAPMITTRTDSPGAAVYPFQNITADIDGDGVLNFVTKLDDSKKAYIKAMDAFADSVNKHKGVDCSHKTVNVEDTTCRVENAQVLKDYKAGGAFEKAITDKSPLFAVNLNKIWNWQPINDGTGNNNFARPGKFVKNSVEMRCYQFSKLKGYEISAADSDFEITLVGEPNLAPYYFPYIGQDLGENNIVNYNKPFMIGQIIPKNDDAWTLKTDPESGKEEISKNFRCDLLAKNIDRPKIGDDFWNGGADVQSWSNDLTKLSIGFVEFGFVF